MTSNKRLRTEPLGAAVFITYRTRNGRARTTDGAVDTVCWWRALGMVPFSLEKELLKLAHHILLLRLRKLRIDRKRERLARGML